MKQICLIEIIHDNNNYCFIVKSFDNYLFIKTMKNFISKNSFNFYSFQIFVFLIYLVYVMIKPISIYFF